MHTAYQIKYVCSVHTSKYIQLRRRGVWCGQSIYHTIHIYFINATNHGHIYHFCMHLTSMNTCFICKLKYHPRTPARICVSKSPMAFACVNISPLLLSRSSFLYTTHSDSIYKFLLRFRQAERQRGAVLHIYRVFGVRCARVFIIILSIFILILNSVQWRAIVAQRFFSIKSIICE